MNAHLNILFIEDSESDALLFEREMKKNGFVVDSTRVQTREELDDALRQDDWNLIVIDYVVPGLNGLDALKICTEKKPFVPIISMSGIVDENVIVETLQSGAYDYVLKSNFRRVSHAVRRAIENAEIRKKNAWNEAENVRLHRELALKYEIADICLSTPEKDMYSAVLNVVLHELDSPLGVFGYVNDRNTLVCPSMTFDVWERCQIPNKTNEFPQRIWGGIWGKALIEKRVTMTNEPCKVPQGHLPITRSLNVPVLYKGERIGLFMVANKTTDYTENDTLLLKMIANHISPILQSRLEMARELYRRKRAENRFALAIEGANDGVWDWDMRTEEMYFSPRWKEMIGYRDEELENRLEVWEERIHPQDLEHVRGMIRSCLYGERDSFSLEYRIRHKNGDYRWILICGACKRNETGKPVLLAGSHTDITEKKLAAEERDRLYKEAEQKASETSSLLDGAKAVLEEDEFIVIARRLFDAGCRNTGATSGYVALLSDDGQENEVLFLESGGLPCSVNPDLPMPVRGLRGQVYASGKVAFDNNFQNSKWMEFLPEGHVQLKNVLFAPLNVEGRTVGIMGLANKPTDFTDQDLHIAEGFGELAAIALKNTRIREALRQSEEKHRLLAENTADVIWMMGLDATFTYVNPAIEKFFGYSPEEFIGTNISNHSDDKNLQIMLEVIQECIAQEPNFEAVTFEVEMIRKDGETIPVEIMGKILTDEDGQPVALQGVTRDITERKKAERALIDYKEHLEKEVDARTEDLQSALNQAEESRERIDTILKSVADGLIVTDRHNHVLLMNRAAEDILGIRFSEAVNRSIEYAIEDKTLREKIMYTLGKQQTGYEFDFTHEDPVNRTKKTMRGRTSVVPDRQGGISGIVTIIQDVTKEREIDRMKTEFISTAAHELRTPLTSIRGFSEILLVRDDIPEESRKKYLGYINKQSVGLANIINDLLDISRIESGIGFALHKELCDGRQAIEAILPQFQEISNKHVFVAELCENPVNLHVDHEKMGQVLTNLLSNSVKYSPKGGTITIKTGIEDAKKDNDRPSFFISVQDEGMGMTQEQVEHIYDKFYRADASNTAIEGTGLGMSIVKHIVEAHDGRIDISSQKGKGTTVTVFLPLNGK